MQEYLIKIFSLLLFAIICTLISCDVDQRTEKVLDPNVTAEIIRYDSILHAWSSTPTQIDLASTIENTPAFTDLYLHQILALPRDTAIMFAEIKRMVQDSGFQKLSSDVRDIYGDMSAISIELNQLLENYQDIFGVEVTPSIYTFISGFVYQCFVFDDIDSEGIGIGLDMFLGADFPYEQINPSNPAFSAYLTQFYTPDYIVKKVAEVLVEDKLPAPQKSDFISLMVWGGKKLYLIDQLIPFKSDDVVIEYTPEQYQWCQENEGQIWDFFFDKNLFYETDIRKFNKLIAPAPTSPGMPQESPGRTANYIGWQIVKKYMANKSGKNAQDLMKEQNAQVILDDSKYKPNR